MTKISGLPLLMVFVSAMMLGGCLGKDNFDPTIEPQFIDMMIAYVQPEAQEPVLSGNFGCDWCSWNMEEGATTDVWVVEDLPVVVDSFYICNINYAPGRFAVEGTLTGPLFNGELYAMTDVMDSLVRVEKVDRNSQGYYNFLIGIDATGNVVP